MINGGDDEKIKGLIVPFVYGETVVPLSPPLYEAVMNRLRNATEGSSVELMQFMVRTGALSLKQKVAYQELMESHPIPEIRNQFKEERADAARGYR